MKHSTRISLGLVLALTSLAAACDDDSGDDAEPRSLMLQIDGLEDLGASAVYEGWLIVDGQPVSTGRFSVGADGVPDAEAFTVDGDDADAATKFVLTIEPAQGDDPAPSNQKLMAGDLSGGEGTLSIGDADALGTDLSEAVGEYFLQTPSSEDPDDWDLGIWYMDLSTRDPSLSLPALPAGWVYEGWIVTEEGPLTTGRFSDPGTEDSDGAGVFAGPLGAPPVAGSDFIEPPTSLIGLSAVISIEPEPDNDPAPFLLKPLVADAIGNVAPPTLQPMVNQSATNNPTGSVRIE